MKVKFLQSLGRLDAKVCKDKFGCELEVADCAEGKTVELPPKVADYLGGKYPALFETVKAVARDAEVKGVK
jgi:hypothetical protein